MDQNACYTLGLKHILFRRNLFRTTKIAILILFLVPACILRAQSEQIALIQSQFYNRAIRQCKNKYDETNNREFLFLHALALSLKDFKWPFYQSSNTKKAIDILLPLTMEFPQDGRFHFRLGLCYYRQRKFNLAFESFTKASELIRGETWITMYRTMAARQAHQLDSKKVAQLVLDIEDDLAIMTNEDHIAFLTRTALDLAKNYGHNRAWLEGNGQFLYSEFSKHTFDFEWISDHSESKTTREKYGLIINQNAQGDGNDTLLYSQFKDWMTSNSWFSFSPEYRPVSFLITYSFVFASDTTVTFGLHESLVTDTISSALMTQLLQIKNGSKIFIECKEAVGQNGQPADRKFPFVTLQLVLMPPKEP